MMEKTIAIQVIRVDFDSLENRNPITQEVVATITDGPVHNRMVKAADWFNQQKIKVYMGYDRQVYPQWKLNEIQVI